MSGFSLNMDFSTLVWARIYQAAGIAFLFVPINTVAYAFMPPNKSNAVSALINLGRNIGGSVGISVVTFFLARRTQAHQNVLVVTYHGDSRRPRTFDILVDGQPLAQERFEAASDDRFFDREYEIPLSAVPQGTPKVTIRFQATGGNDVAAVFGVRVVRR